LANELSPAHGDAGVMAERFAGRVEISRDVDAARTAPPVPVMTPSTTCSSPATAPGCGVRCRRRAAVQVARIERLMPLDEGDCALLLRGGVRVPCSRQYCEAVLARL